MRCCVRMKDLDISPLSSRPSLLALILLPTIPRPIDPSPSRLDVSIPILRRWMLTRLSLRTRFSNVDTPHVPKGEWYTWMSSPRPECTDFPAIYLETKQDAPLGRTFGTEEEQRRAEKLRLRVSDRLLLIAVLRPDRLNHAIDRLVESVLGPSFLQASSSAVLTDTHENPEALFADFAKVSVAGVSLCSAILLEVSADDAVDCFAHMRAAAGQSRACFMLHDISTAAASMESPAADPHKQVGEQRLETFSKEMEHLLTHDHEENVWLVVKCDPLTSSAAETINGV